MFIKVNYILGLLNRLINPKMQQRGLDNYEPLASLRAGLQSSSGVSISSDNALTIGTVYASVRVISESIASLPLITYKRNGRSKQRFADHPLYTILHDLPNPEMSAMSLRETLTAHTVLRGNGYAEIDWDRSGYPSALYPLRPDRMEDIRRVDGELFYFYRLPDGQGVRLPAYRVMHIRGLSPDGMYGYNPIALMRNAIGLTKATEEYGSKFFANGAIPSIVVKHPGTLSDGAYDRLIESWEARHQGLENAHRIAILEEGMSVDQVGMAPEDAQFLDTRKFQRSEIASIFRVPAHMIGDLDKASYASIEQQSLDFVTYTLRPWLVRWEQAIYKDLLLPRERATVFAEHLVDALLRGDLASRYAAYQIGRQGGWLSANDVREIENMNPFDDGDTYLMPLNMVPVGTPQSPETQRSADACTCGIEHRNTPQPQIETRDASTEKIFKRKQKLANSFIPALQDSIDRIVRREANDLRRSVNKFLRKRSLQDFQQWLAEFYADYRNVVVDNLTPIFVTFAPQILALVGDELDTDVELSDEMRDWIGGFIGTLANTYIESSQNQIDTLIGEASANDSDPADLIDERLDGWQETKADKMAMGQSFEFMNALSVVAYASAGVTFLQWMARGDSCPFCKKMDGKVVGIDSHFVGAGTKIDAEDGSEPMLVRHKKRYGPLHGGCDCTGRAGRN